MERIIDAGESFLNSNDGKNFGTVYVILSKTQPEIVDFTFYVEEATVQKRVEDLNKLAKRREYWYITLYSSHRNSENDGEIGTKKSEENLVPERWDWDITGENW